MLRGEGFFLEFIFIFAILCVCVCVCVCVVFVFVSILLLNPLSFLENGKFVGKFCWKMLKSFFFMFYAAFFNEASNFKDVENPLREMCCFFDVSPCKLYMKSRKIWKNLWKNYYE